MNYKIGDIVRIVHKYWGHGFRIGEKVKIKEIYNGVSGEHYYAVNNDDGWYVWPNEIAPTKAKIV